MAMSVQEIRGWLLQHPRAHTLRVITTDDRHHEVSITSGVSWMSIAQSVHALQPMLIEAYDSKGHVLRAVRPEDEEENEDEERRGPRAPQPLVMPTNLDPQSTMMIHFADLIAAAYRHATDVAFERMVGLFESANSRVESLERSVESMQKLVARAQEEQQQQFETQAPAPDLLSQMVQGFTSASGVPIHQTNGTPPPNGKAD